jgi:hypothetical protein
MSTLADDVARQSALLERIQLEIFLAHARVFHCEAPSSWQRALTDLEGAAACHQAHGASRTLPDALPEERIAPFGESPVTSIGRGHGELFSTHGQEFGDQWEPL